MKIAKDMVVSFEYTLTDNDGNIIDKSEGRGPLSYIQGYSMIIPGLEKEMEGKEEGHQMNVKVSPEEGYGHRDDTLVQSVPRDRFDADEVKVGDHFQVDAQMGPMVFKVVKVDDEEVTLDGNHPLAGLELNFDVTIAEIREATKEELEHGHVH